MDCVEKNPAFINEFNKALELEQQHTFIEYTSFSYWLIIM